MIDTKKLGCRRQVAQEAGTQYLECIIVIMAICYTNQRISYLSSYLSTLYIVSQITSAPNSWRWLCQFLTDFQNSFTAGKRTKFPTKHIILPTIPSMCCRATLWKLCHEFGVLLFWDTVFTWRNVWWNHLFEVLRCMEAKRGLYKKKIFGDLRHLKYRYGGEWW